MRWNPGTFTVVLRDMRTEHTGFTARVYQQGVFGSDLLAGRIVRNRDEAMFLARQALQYKLSKALIPSALYPAIKFVDWGDVEANAR